MAAVVEQVKTTELRSATAGRNPWALAWSYKKIKNYGQKNIENREKWK